MRSQYTQPPNGSLIGMLSQSTSVRLAPVDPVARSETPCVVGLATTLDDRRNRLKPGIWRRRSSNSAPGMSCSCCAPRVVMAAGVSLERTVLTVTLVLRVGGLGELASGSLGSCALAARIERIAAARTITCRRIVKVMDENFAVPALPGWKPASRATRILKGT
jgi:hypothetical protein